MFLSVVLHDYGYEKVAHALILIFWIGGGFGCLVYVKAKVDKVRLHLTLALMRDLMPFLSCSHHLIQVNPNFGFFEDATKLLFDVTACSLVSIITSVV